MSRDNLRQTANVVSLVIAIALNGLANALPINGQTTGAISDRFPIFFVPAGYVFSIWGVIYLSLVAFALYQARVDQKDNPRLRRLGWLFVLSNLLNAGWILLWHYEMFPLTLVFIGGLLLTLVAIYLRLGTGREPASLAENVFVRLPFSIYLGWVSVATIANASQLLYWLGWSGAPLSGQAWAAIMLGVATALGAAIAWTRRDLAYLLVFVWAFAGIGVKQAGEPLVATTASLATGVAAVLVAALLFLRARAGARVAV